METLKERFLPIFDPKTFYLTNNLKTAIGRIDYVLERRCGLTSIFGDVGVGKTTLLHFLHAKYESNESYTTAFVLASESQSGFVMLKQISSAFGLDLKRTFYDQQKLLESWLIDQYHKGKNIVVFIDDAHKLHSKHLDIIRSLVNLEPFFQKVVQVVLVGQLQLRNKLLLHRNRDLLSRMFAPSIISAFSLEETKEIIYFLCNIAEIDNPFSDDVISTIYKLTKGVAREIIKLCIYAYKHSDSIITSDIIYQINSSADFTQHQQTILLSDTLLLNTSTQLQRNSSPSHQD